MASDPTTDPDPDPRPALLGHASRGLFAGAVAGSAVGLLDGLIAWYAGHDVVGPADLLTVLSFYALSFAPFGVVAALISRWFAWPSRAMAYLIGIGASFFFLAAYANVRLLPDWKSGLSLAADVVLVAFSVWWFRRAYFGAGNDEIRLGRWSLVGLICWAVAGIALPLADTSDGPEVIAARRPDAPGARPNVLVFVTDTLRADHLGCYGYERPTSPEIDLFAADAVVFEECRAPSSWTKPSVASLLTALYPSQHACIQQKEILVPEAHTLPEVMKAAGWRTGAFSDNPFISPEFGFGQGFDQFDAQRPSVVANGTLLGKVLFMLRLLSLSGEPLGVGVKHYRGVETLIDGEQGLFRFLDDAGDAPWFAYVQAMEPHLPYDPKREDAVAFGYPKDRPYEPPPPYNGALPFQVAPEPAPEVKQRVIAQYDAEIRGLSREFGRVLDDLKRRGQYENTIVVFVSDHGEEFHDHGGWKHGHSLHREVIRVPLIVRFPESLGAEYVRARGRRVKGACSLLDVFRMLTGACAIDDPGFPSVTEAGSTVLERCRAKEGDDARVVHLPQSDAKGRPRSILGEVDSGPVRLRSLRRGRWLYIRSETPFATPHVALYDVVSRPDETRDLADQRDAERIDLGAELSNLMKVLEDNALTARSRKLSDAEDNQLRGLGYAGNEDEAKK